MRGKLLFASRRACRVFGVSRERLLCLEGPPSAQASAGGYGPSCPIRNAFSLSNGTAACPGPRSGGSIVDREGFQGQASAEAMARRNAVAITLSKPGGSGVSSGRRTAAMPGPLPGIFWTGTLRQMVLTKHGRPTSARSGQLRAGFISRSAGKRPPGSLSFLPHSWTCSPDGSSALRALLPCKIDSQDQFFWATPGPLHKGLPQIS